MRTLLGDANYEHARDAQHAVDACTVLRAGEAVENARAKTALIRARAAFLNGAAFAMLAGSAVGVGWSVWWWVR